MRTNFKEFVLRLPPELYEAAKLQQHKEMKDSFANFIRDTLTSYLQYQGHKIGQNQSLEPESFFEKPSETISEMLNSAKQIGPTSGAWDLPAWNKED